MPTKPDSTMFNPTFIYTTYLLCQIITSMKLLTSVDDIKLYTNPKYMDGSVEIIYLGKNHYEYLVNIEQIFVRNISNVYVRIHTSLPCHNIMQFSKESISTFFSAFWIWGIVKKMRRLTRRCSIIRSMFADFWTGGMEQRLWSNSSLIYFWRNKTRSWVVLLLLR